MNAQRVLDLWTSAEPAWRSQSGLDESGRAGVDRLPAGFHLAKRNRQHTITDEGHAQSLPLLAEDLEETVSWRSVAPCSLLLNGRGI